MEYWNIIGPTLLDLLLASGCVCLAVWLAGCLSGCHRVGVVCRSEGGVVNECPID